MNKTRRIYCSVIFCTLLFATSALAQVDQSLERYEGLGSPYAALDNRDSDLLTYPTTITLYTQKYFSVRGGGDTSLAFGGEEIESNESADSGVKDAKGNDINTGVDNNANLYFILLQLTAPEIIYVNPSQSGNWGVHFQLLETYFAASGSFDVNLYGAEWNGMNWVRTKQEVDEDWSITLKSTLMNFSLFYGRGNFGVEAGALVARDTLETDYDDFHRTLIEPFVAVGYRVKGLDASLRYSNFRDVFVQDDGDGDDLVNTGNIIDLTARYRWSRSEKTLWTVMGQAAYSDFNSELDEELGSADSLKLMVVSGVQTKPSARSLVYLEYALCYRQITLEPKDIDVGDLSSENKFFFYGMQSMLNAGLEYYLEPNLAIRFGVNQDITSVPRNHWTMGATYAMNDSTVITYTYRATDFVGIQNATFAPVMSDFIYPAGHFLSLTKSL